MILQGASVDPGCVKGHGVALWKENGELASAFLIPSEDPVIVWGGVLVIEIPVVRQTGLQKGSQRDIVNLALAAGKLIGTNSNRFQSVVELCPEQWAGQIPKDVKYKRILERLTEDEKASIDWPKQKALRMDVVEAIGIGLHIFSPARSLMRKGT